MSKDQYTKEDELKETLDKEVVNENKEEKPNNEETKSEDNKEEKKEEPTAEELIQIEKDKYLRLFAEFENYKKRTSRERIELFKTAGQEIMSALLPIIDDFERAMSHIEDKPETKEVKDGVVLIHKKFVNTLQQKGLSAIEVNAGDDFDAEVHQAITQIPAPSEELKGKIVDCTEKGYKLGDKIIRHPKVVVGQQ